jgi:hypothetical protein
VSSDCAGTPVIDYTGELSDFADTENGLGRQVIEFMQRRSLELRKSAAK